MSSTKPLGQFIPPRLDEPRRTRQFEQIWARREQRARSWRRFAVPALVFVAAVAAVLVVVRSRSAPVAAAAGVTDVALVQGGDLTLADGSHVKLDQAARLKLARIEPALVRLLLEQGAADFEVAHNPNRSFVVAAAGYEVRVVGTRFRVERRGEQGLSVSVVQGRVEVRREGQDQALQVLDAGQSWSVALERVPAPPKPRAETAALAPMPSTAASEPSRPARAAPTAKQLFERAQTARAAGRLDEAKALLSSLRTTYPNDPRASLAAFELARIELDNKGDAKQAAKTLEDAIASAPAGAPYREDAEARRVEALEAAGDHAGCIAARNAYLARYPKGVHRAQVAARCKRR
jgi:hypothetical protein